MSARPDLPPPSDAPQRRSAVGRALAVVAAVLVVLGVGLGAVALTTADAGEAGNAVVLEVEDAITRTPPATVAPIEPGVPRSATVPTENDGGQRNAANAVDAANAGGERNADGAADTENDVDIGVSPLAELLDPPFSVVPDDVAPRPRPVGIVIDSIDVDDYPVRDVGLEDDGQLEVPDETEIGWYRYGATAGQPGATVLAAHVSWNRTIGPFFELGTVDPGARVEVALDDGSTRVYEVVERTMYDKNELPRERIWRNTGPETLVLITCGGDFNPEIRRYRQNIVVYAVPVS